MLSSACLIILSVLYILTAFESEDLNMCVPSILEHLLTIVDVIVQMTLLILVPSFVWIQKGSVYWYIYLCIVISNFYWAAFDIWFLLSSTLIHFNSSHSQKNEL